jgi:hypothetical protein
MTDDENDVLIWRNLVTHWHLKRPAPLDCGCDDDTEDTDFCAPSVTWADEEYAARPDQRLSGPEDPWSHDAWRAAWGHNATLIVDDRDLRLPTLPVGLSWLARRLLVGGRCAVELLLYRTDAGGMTALSRARLPAEPSTVAARARRMMREDRP